MLLLLGTSSSGSYPSTSDLQEALQCRRRSQPEGACRFKFKLSLASECDNPDAKDLGRGP